MPRVCYVIVSGTEVSESFVADRRTWDASGGFAIQLCSL